MFGKIVSMPASPEAADIVAVLRILRETSASDERSEYAALYQDSLITTHGGPIAQADGHDTPRLVDELVP
jgi:hypothetical protein